MKKAFITGITGQDGSYLAELLLKKGYQVHAIIRRSSVFTTQRINKFFNHKNLFLYHGDLTDSSNLHRLLTEIKPDEIYNLGAQSHVAVSFEVPEYTGEVVALGTIRILDAIRDTGIESKFYQASTSELFGGIPGTEPQDETTPFYPKSPYGAAKLYAYWATVNYRESYDLFACNGILFNHESPRRGETFVTKKITLAVAKIKHGLQKTLYLGNLNARRDWGYAKDYVQGMWQILQAEKPDNYVLATGKNETIRNFAVLAFRTAGIEIEFEGEKENEIGINIKTGNPVIRIEKKHYRPAEVDTLLGNPKKANDELNWKATTSLEKLAEIMVEYDLKSIGN